MENFRAFDLSVDFYRLAKRLQIPCHLKDQLVRAAYSISLNLAEGRARGTLKDQLRFFHISLGSARECQAVLILEEMKDTEAWQLLDKVAASVYCLIKRAR